MLRRTLVILNQNGPCVLEASGTPCLNVCFKLVISRLFLYIVIFVCYHLGSKPRTPGLKMKKKLCEHFDAAFPVGSL